MSQGVDLPAHSIDILEACPISRSNGGDGPVPTAGGREPHETIVRLGVRHDVFDERHDGRLHGTRWQRATELLGSLPHADTRQALIALLDDPVSWVRTGAAEGLARLADTTAIPDLIDAHSRGGEASEYSRKALFEITNQDFGNSTRKWRGWWSKNQDRNRIEWMLEGLGHKNADVRKSAAETLHKITGEYFGYSHDLPKKEREKARQQWNEWWHDAGKERFAASKH